MTEIDLSQSDKVREYCKINYVDIAKKHGLLSIAIRAGDVHSKLKLSNQLPLVCAALGANKFEECCGVRRVHIDGPLNGANTIFVYLFK